jgi:RNA polymerase-binding transcription factor
MGRSQAMPGKKTGTKTSKQRRPAAARVAPRRAAARKPAAASRKAVAASTAKPVARSSRAAETQRSPVHSSDHASPAQPAKPVAAPVAPILPVARTVAAESSPGPSARALTAPDNDENEAAEPGSLLAGPRNVKPYVAKRGEQYMSKEQLAHFQQILLNWKRDLMEEVDRTVSHMKDEAANFPDPNDRATQEEEFSLELRTRDRERKLIRKIDEALKRIEDGTYGYCLETGEEIGIKRLEARPVATLSIEAQERRERRERQYGDRDDRYR